MRRVGSRARGGTYFDSVAGDTRYWPNDGIVALSSALAVAVPPSVLPRRSCLTVHDTHSIFVSDAAGAEWSTALTWDPAVLTTVDEALSSVGTQPTGAGCLGM
jgi:triacylglycerol lipase